MAGRKDKNIVDYFPHYCIPGKTMFIIESKFGHKGYAIWFKTLELLGASENHYIDLRDESDLLFLVSKLKVTEEELNDIYNMLSKLNAIDSFMWSKKIIYSENFINNVADAYKRRSNKCMQKCDLCKHLRFICNKNADKCGQKSTKESKVKESKEDKSKYTLGREILNSVYSLFDPKYFDTETKKKKALETIRLLIEQDKKAKDEIISVIKFARTDDFWKQNFLSVPSLRKKNQSGVMKYDSIISKMGTESKQNQETKKVLPRKTYYGQNC